MNTNTDLVWSELSQQMISKSELDEFAKAWTAQTAWADDFDFEETSPIVRRQSSWSDIMKRERVGEIKKEVKTSKREEEEGEEVVKDLDKPDGQFRKPSDVSNLKEIYPGFHFTSLESGLVDTVDWFINNYPNLRK